jgi:hypothetical protein
MVRRRPPIKRVKMRTSVDTSTASWYARGLDAERQSDSSRRETTGTESAGTEGASTEAAPAPGISLEDVTSPRAQANLARLAERLGIDPAALLAKVASGEDVRSLLSGPRDAGYGAPLAPPATGGIAIDQYV